MDNETRAAFARIDRYFELNQQQVAELRSEVRANTEGLQSTNEALQALRSELRGFRDWTETSFARIRTELKELRSWAEAQFADVRTELQRLGARIDRLEQRRGDLRV